MEYTFIGFMKNSVTRNKITFTVLALCSVLSVVLTLFGAGFSSFTFAAFFIALISAAVCFVCVLASTVTHYFRAVHKSGIKQFDSPIRPVFSAIVSNLLLCAVILAFTLATVFSFFSTFKVYAGQNAELAESVLKDIATLKQLGYSDVSFIASMLLCSFFEYVDFLVTVICSVSLARYFKERKVLASVLGVFFINLISSYFQNILTAVAANFASGIFEVVNNINKFYNDFRNSLTTHETVKVPYASDFTKLYLFSSMCTLILIITLILISKTALKFPIKNGEENTDNKNNI